MKHVSTLLAVKISLVAFLLNWAWEVTQLSLYTSDLEAIPILRRLIHCLPATIADAFFTGGIYCFGAVLLRDREWIKRLNFARVLGIVGVGAAAAVFVETLALHGGYWNYGPAMPTLPFVEAGLLPVFQLALLPLAAFFLASRQ